MRGTGLTIVAALVAGCFSGRDGGVDPDPSFEEPSEVGDPPAGSQTGDAPDEPADATTSGGDLPDDPAGTTGPGDTAESSGGPDAPPPRADGLDCDSRDDLLLCDDFDAGIDAAKWDVVENNGGTVMTDDTVAFHGTSSLHVSLPSADGARAAVRTTAPFPVADNHFFGRAMFLVTPDAPETHASAFAASGNLDGTTAQYRLDSNGRQFNSRYTHPATVEQHGGLKKFGYDVPVDQWLCVEWEYDGAANEMRYWMDGVAIDSMTVTEASETQPWIAPIFASFELGYRTYQAGSVAGGYDVYWDAVALATFRIGCE